MTYAEEGANAQDRTRGGADRGSVRCRSPRTLRRRWLHLGDEASQEVRSQFAGRIAATGTSPGVSCVMARQTVGRYLAAVPLTD